MKTGKLTIFAIIWNSVLHSAIKIYDTSNFNKKSVQCYRIYIISLESINKLYLISLFFNEILRNSNIYLPTRILYIQQNSNINSTKMQHYIQLNERSSNEKRNNERDVGAPAVFNILISVL